MITLQAYGTAKNGYKYRIVRDFKVKTYVLQSLWGTIWVNHLYSEKLDVLIRIMNKYLLETSVPREYEKQSLDW